MHHEIEKENEGFIEKYRDLQHNGTKLKKQMQIKREKGQNALRSRASRSGA